jgi:carboxylate-amine ligase
MTRLPDWAEWNAGAPWTVGIEEEVMLLDPRDWSLASRIGEVLQALPPAVAHSASAETHGSTLELASRPHATVAAAVGELVVLRAGLAAALAPLELRAAVSGTHPFAQWSEIEVSPGARYRSIYDSMRELARREPTFGLHVHVAVPDAESAVCALRGMRVHVPLLLALAANSPFWQGRDTGLASARVPIFDTFPRVGIPRRFSSYAEYVEAVDVLLRCDAFPEPTFLWWDVRLQPKLGTIELRIMDAQTRVADNAALAALVQCAVRLEATEGYVDEAIAAGGARREPLPRRARRHARRAPRSRARHLPAGARHAWRAARRVRAARGGTGLRGGAGIGRGARGRAGLPPPADARRRRSGRPGRTGARPAGRGARLRVQHRGAAGRAAISCGLRAYPLTTTRVDARRPGAHRGAPARATSRARPSSSSSPSSGAT